MVERARPGKLYERHYRHTVGQHVPVKHYSLTMKYKEHLKAF
jgi:hypothetical protein